MKKLFNFLLNFSIKHNLNSFYLLLFKLRLNSVPDKISKYQNDKGIFFRINNKNFERIFHNKFQGYISYKNGLTQRAKILGEQVYLLDNLTFKKNDVVVDVGANHGDLKLYFQYKKINITYYAIEPGLYEYQCLKKNIGKNILNLCAGNKNSTQELYYKPSNGDSSLIEISDYSMKYSVKVKTLDSLIEDKLIPSKIKLIKLEAEGFEPEILCGIKNNLNNVEFISADLGFERGLNQDTTAPEVINFLLANNFSLVSMSSIRNVFLFKNLNFD